MHWRISFITSLATLALGCANETTPVGGPKDEAPPKLISSIPANRQVGYTAKMIRMEFDEHVATNQPSQKILIVPAPPGKEIKYTVKGKALIIEPEKGWEDSTTYTIALGEGVRDITENNPAKDVKLSFSTGPYIDSLSVFGRVNFALKSEFPKDKKATVALYRSDTSDVFEDKPYYFSQTDEAGRFQIDNMAEGVYYAYAFVDGNGNFKVESRSEPYGFLKDSLLVQVAQSDSVFIRMVEMDSRPLNINAVINNGLYTKVTFNKPIERYTLGYSYDTTVVNCFGKDLSELLIYNPPSMIDSLQFTLHAEALPESSADSAFYIVKKEKGKNFVPDKFTAELGESTMDPDSFWVKTKIVLSKPLKRMILDSAYIVTDSAGRITFSPKDFSYDTVQKTLSLSMLLSETIEGATLLAQEKSISVHLGKAFIMSIEGDSSSEKSISIPYTKKEELGTLLITVSTEQPSYIIQLIDKSGEVVMEAKDVKKHAFENIRVNEYGLRAVTDKNANGKWDPGNIYKREEPEAIYFYQTTDGAYFFPIRANWELGPFNLEF